MPTGNVVWIDRRSGEARVEAKGHPLFPLRIADAEPEARVVGARVHSDAARRDGVVWAVNVRLLEGTRTSPGQHRRGDLVGAKHADEAGHKGLTHQQRKACVPTWRRSHERLSSAGGRSLEDGYIGDVLVLYAPQAKLHAGSRTYAGHSGIGGYLAALPFEDLRTLTVEVRGEGRTWFSSGGHRAMPPPSAGRGSASATARSPSG
jgi:hypothetical protein